MTKPTEIHGTEKPDSAKLLKDIESNIQSQKDLALFRIRLLDESSESCHDDDVVATGLPALFVPILRKSVENFLKIFKDLDRTVTRTRLSELAAVKELQRVLRLYQTMARLDATLNEEIGMEGAHSFLSQVIKLESMECCYEKGEDLALEEANQDAVMELQDQACEIASYSKSFPVVATPLTTEELRARLPLFFRFAPSSNTKDESTGDEPVNEQLQRRSVDILINQVNIRQSSQKDVGFVMWPSAVVLSQWIIEHPELVQGKTVLELGAGCGLVGMAVGKLQQQQAQIKTLNKSNSTTISSAVVLSDFNGIVVQNLARNLELNGLQDLCSATGLDFFQQETSTRGWTPMDGQRMPQVDVVLASDVICQPEDAFAVAKTIVCALKAGGIAVMVSADSKHRFGVEHFEAACEEVGSLALSVQNVNHIYRGILSSMAMTSGFVEGMSLTMYTMKQSD
jgi:predicted nicotinamide N-methyase